MDHDGFVSVFCSAPDGLRLHARDYGSRLWRRLPVVCLAGLTRNAHDFHALALALSTDPERPRRVVALDYRGRGLSGHDPDWRRYDVKIEAADTASQLAALDIAEAVFVGTSRGGLVIMALAAMRPAMIKAAVLNDIGPKIEAQGLLRIRSSAGQLPRPSDWAEAAKLLESISGGRFPALTDEDWLALAQGSWREENALFVPAYDPGVLKPLAALDLEVPLPDLWPLFGGLTPMPMLAIRGANSDLFSRDTLEEMARRHPRLETLNVEGQGHAPLLRDAPTIERIAAFIDAVGPGPADAECARRDAAARRI